VTRWALYAAVPLLAVAAVSLAFAMRSSRAAPQHVSMTPPASTSAAATWRAGAKRAPDFALHDENGKPISIASLRGRPVLVAFLDPLCRDFCPIEAQRLGAAVRSATGAKPAIIAVSVNTLGNQPSVLKLDRRKWDVPSGWHWAVGSKRELARVWRAYHIFVMTTAKTLAGVRTQSVSHTEASYLVDANGYQRAVFLWPYTASAVTSSLRATAP
jgi:cytochrome oxidase Cu insertion factor (SCO1/SenC/PrrC family)